MSCKTCGAEFSKYESKDSFYAENRTEMLKVPDGHECLDCDRKSRHRDSIHEWVERELMAMGGSLAEIQERWKRHMLIPDNATQRAEDNEEIRKAFFELRKHSRAYWRGTSMFIRRYGEPEMKVGTKIYRMVAFRAGWRHGAHEPRIDDPQEFQRTDQGDYLVYADYGHSFGVEIWTAKAKAHRGRGFKCFSKQAPPADWTHFEIRHFAKNGRSAHVEPVVGTKEELIAAYGDPGKPLHGQPPEKKDPEIGATPVASKVHVAAAAPPPKPPYICTSCAAKGRGSSGPGRCLVCKQEFSDRPIRSDRDGGRAW